MFLDILFCSFSVFFTACTNALCILLHCDFVNIVATSRYLIPSWSSYWLLALLLFLPIWSLDILWTTLLPSPWVPQFVSCHRLLELAIPLRFLLGHLLLSMLVLLCFHPSPSSWLCTPSCLHRTPKCYNFVTTSAFLSRSCHIFSMTGISIV